MGFEPMTSRLSAERANQAVPLAYNERANQAVPLAYKI